MEHGLERSEPQDSSRRAEGTAGATTAGSLTELKNLVQEFQTAMLITTTPEGLLRARPMAIQKPAPELTCDVWFVTSIHTAMVEEIARHPKVCVTCLRDRGSAYASISAHATVFQDEALVHKLWQPDWKIWWPKGPDDPQIAFLLLQVERAEYWEPEGGAVRVLYEMIKGLVKREPADQHLPPPKKI
jgi:general stress protein 26